MKMAAVAASGGLCAARCSASGAQRAGSASRIDIRSLWSRVAGSGEAPGQGTGGGGGVAPPALADAACLCFSCAVCSCDLRPHPLLHHLCSKACGHRRQRQQRQRVWQRLLRPPRPVGCLLRCSRLWRCRRQRGHRPPRVHPGRRLWRAVHGGEAGEPDLAAWHQAQGELG